MELDSILTLRYWYTVQHKTDRAHTLKKQGFDAVFPLLRKNYQFLGQGNQQKLLKVSVYVQRTYICSSIDEYESKKILGESPILYNSQDAKKDIHARLYKFNSVSPIFRTCVCADRVIPLRISTLPSLRYFSITLIRGFDKPVHLLISNFMKYLY